MSIYKSNIERKFQYQDLWYYFPVKIKIKDFRDDIVKVGDFTCIIGDRYYVAFENKYTFKKEFIPFKKELFYNNIICVMTDIEADVKLIVPKDTSIDKLVIGWAWYIFLMLVFTIFNMNVFLWCITSYVFFSWRRKVKKEESYYA